MPKKLIFGYFLVVFCPKTGGLDPLKRGSGPPKNGVLNEKPPFLRGFGPLERGSGGLKKGSKNGLGPLYRGAWGHFWTPFFGSPPKFNSRAKTQKSKKPLPQGTRDLPHFCHFNRIGGYPLGNFAKNCKKTQKKGVFCPFQPA